ncbi:MAG: N-6 DNA methylase [Nitrospinota bacterium]
MKSRQFGDFQTPHNLVQSIIQSLGPVGKFWNRVLEPTCGHGGFIKGIIESKGFLPKEIVGIEIQDDYLKQAGNIIPPANTSIRIIKADIFRFSLKDIKWETKGPLLVIGNPPWVTSSEIGAVNGSNLPDKKNIKGLRGIDAITGKSNFDIAEFIWIKLINELLGQNATIALLCKTSVARNILRYVYKSGLPVSNPEIRIINAKKSFGAAVEACLFSLKVGAHEVDYNARIFDSVEAAIPKKTIGFVKGNLVSDLNAYNTVSFVEGESPLEWRQGIKHDAANVMELLVKNRKWYNRFGERVEIEQKFIYPLLKSSDVRPGKDVHSSGRGVIVPQKKVGEDTRFLKQMAPKLWTYLQKYKAVFELRKSSIYKLKYPFSVFGVGTYSFSKYKVITSGFFKSVNFIATGTIEKKPVFVDDTCYLLACESALQAASIAAILNHPLSKKFINSIIFKDSKRPITKSVLSRIDINSLADKIKLDDVWSGIASNLKEMESVSYEELIKPVDLLTATGFDEFPAQKHLLYS